MITEIVGALPGKYLLAALRIPTDSTGACAGLAPGLQVVRASLPMPLVFRLF
ncbi:MAG: hypothetical protein HYX42_05165 [Polaromonas sp.]|nr:hypothetical protein [Polaromonas sp.]